MSHTIISSIEESLRSSLAEMMNPSLWVGKWGVSDRQGQFTQASELWELETEQSVKAGFRTSQLKLTAKADIDVEGLVYFRMPCEDVLLSLGLESATMLINGQNINDGEIGLTDFPAREERLPNEPLPESAWWSVIGGENCAERNYVLYGFMLPVRHRTVIRQKDGYFEVVCLTDRNLKAGETFTGDILLVKISDSPHALLEEFGDVGAERVPSRTSVERPLAWNSWDYYYNCFNVDDLRETLEVVKEANITLVRPVEYIVLDMCWQTDFGEWIPNGRFPCGMKAVAEMIREAGFIPGLWFAPYFADYTSKTALRHADICVMDEDGIRRPCGDGIAPNLYIDPTHPGGEEYLYNLFRQYRDDGFAYFKLDFLHYPATSPGRRRFFKDDLGRIEIIKLGLKIIRRAIGEESYMLACGCQQEAAAGVADACRIGGDISNYFSTTRIIAAALSTRYWENNRLYVTDPDFLIVRGTATAEDPEFFHNPFHFPREGGAETSRSGSIWSTESESRIWATLAAMSGGAVTLADHLGKLNDRGYHILNTAIRFASTDAARPLDIMHHRLPELWLRDGSVPALAVVNWSDDVRSIELPVERYPLIRSIIEEADIWQSLSVDRSAECFRVTVQPRDVAWFVDRRNLCPLGDGDSRNTFVLDPPTSDYSL